MGARPGFSEVGLAYARWYRELEHSRKQFNEERVATFKALALAEVEALKAAGMKFSEDYVKKPGSKDREPRFDIDTWTWNIEALYFHTWNERKKRPERQPNRSGLDIWLSDLDDEPFAFRAVLWFNDEEERLIDGDAADDALVVDPTHEVSKSLCRCGIAAPDNVWLIDGQIQIAVSIVGLQDGLTLDTLLREARRLPEAFAKADGILAEMYAARDVNGG